MQKNIIIVSEDIYTESTKELKRLGYNLVFSYNNKAVNSYLSKHVDMQLVKTNENTLVSSPECFEYYNDVLASNHIRLVKGESSLSRNYPGDIAYNVSVGKDNAIHNFKYTDSVVKETLGDKCFINVSQGYTSCTLCRINDTAYITSDAGIYNTLANYKINVLQISAGNILLPGFDYGFIGGAMFYINKVTLAVNGNINYHPDSEKIISFCKQYNVDVVSLSDNPIMDIGSAILI